MLRNILVGCALGMTAFFVSNSSGNSLRVIAQSGQVPPGIDGAFFNSKMGAKLTSSGDVWILSGLVGTNGEDLYPDAGLFRHNGHETQLIMRQGDVLTSGGVSQEVLLFDPEERNDALITWWPGSSELSFHLGSLTGHVDGYWTRHLDGTLGFHENSELVATEVVNNYAFTRAVRIAETGWALVDSRHIYSSERHVDAVWVRSPEGESVLVAQGYTAAPGAGDDTVFNVHVEPIDISENGYVLVSGQTAQNADVVPLPLPSEPFSLWKKGPASELVPVVIGGQTVPGGGYVFDGVYRGEVNQTGSVAFHSWLARSDNAGERLSSVWLDVDGSPLRRIAMIGDETIGAPEGFAFVGDGFSYDLSDGNRVMLRGFLSDGSETREAIFQDSGAGLELLAMENERLMAEPFGATIDEILNDPHMNASGQVFFSATLLQDMGDVDASNTKGIWGQDGQGTLRLIARTGDPVMLDSGNQLTIVDLNLTDGPDHLINASGEVAFFATLSDGTEAVIFSNLVAVPEPAGSAVALAFAVATAGALRRSRCMSRLRNCDR